MALKNLLQNGGEFMAIKNENHDFSKNVIYYPTNDYIFRTIFGTPGKEKITISLLSSILSENIISVDLDNNYQITPENINDKLGILDIKATINNNIKCDIEMQISRRFF